ASSAIPLLFPPARIGMEYYGDGSMRDYTPLSPSIRLGAEKLLVVGVRKAHQVEEPENALHPTPGRILSVVLNGILLDSLDYDYERLQRINQTLKSANVDKANGLKPIDVLLMTPSRKISEIAKEELSSLTG